MTTILVSVLLLSNLTWMSILGLIPLTPIAYHHSSIDKLEGMLDSLLNLVTQLVANQKPASVARVYDIHSSNDNHTSVCPSSQQSGLSARNDAIDIRGVHDVATDTSAETRNLEGKQDALANLVTQLAVNQKPASVARVCGIRSSNDHHTSVCPSSQQYGVDDHPRAYAANTNNTSAETRKLEGKLDALLNLVTLVAANQKPASVARIYGIHSSNDHHTSVCPSLQQLEWMSILRLMLQAPIADHHSSRHKALDREDGFQLLALEGKLDALVNLMTQLAANQTPASVERICCIRSSKDHHTIVCPSSQQSGVDDKPESYAANTYSRPPQSSRGKALDREDVSQLLALRIKILPLVQESASYVLPMTTILVFVLLRSNLESMSILRLMLRTPIGDHDSSRDNALDREDGSQLLAIQFKK
ncbi:hypothetical protein Fmac_028577 [Flemingia macrophylla]|uniref:Uncharacterized protein n=1 Tax=Flemingia macrophylla TaxID=520843 RepID=A0ABD1L8B2_9FABA